MANKLEHVAKAIARGCHAELVGSDMPVDEYVGQYWHLFKRAAENAIAEMENA